jgi:hypothetical protein
MANRCSVASIGGNPAEMAPPYDGPVATPRYRCASCGNLTRFDVVSTRRTRAFHHFTVGGDLVVEEEEVLADEVESVACRWCGPSGAVEVLDGSLAEVVTAQEVDAS